MTQNTFSASGRKTRLRAGFYNGAIRPRTVENLLRWRRRAGAFMLTFLLGIAVSCSYGQAQDLVAPPDGLSPRTAPKKQHLKVTGKPCIAMESYATAQPINKDIFEHWIRASNSCGQNIRVRVCYRKTTDCILMTVPPWETKSAVLGIYPHVKGFKYDATEQF